MKPGLVMDPARVHRQRILSSLTDDEMWTDRAVYVGMVVVRACISANGILFVATTPEGPEVTIRGTCSWSSNLQRNTAC